MRREGQKLMDLSISVTVAQQRNAPWLNRELVNGSPLNGQSISGHFALYENAKFTLN